MTNRIIYLLSLAFILSCGCEREYINEIVSVVAPELHVIVKDTNNIGVTGVQVKLFNSEDNYNSGIGDIATGITNESGLAIFTKNQLRNPGIFYVYAAKGPLNNNNSNIATPFILLNDGHTLFFTRLE